MSRELKQSQIHSTARNPTIDILRGLAIFTMIAGNLAGSILIQPQPFWLRFYYSFAAPLFIFIAGMMVDLTSHIKYHQLNYFLLRGLAIVIINVLIDLLIYKIYPFTDCDVLYLIGISLPLTYLFSKLNLKLRISIIITIFALTPILQRILGYSQEHFVFHFREESLVNIFGDKKSILHSWIIDGWFPIFPWLGFSFLGQIFYDICQKLESLKLLKDTWGLVIGFCLLIIGGIIWWQHPGHLYIRFNYAELFYPPTIGFILTAIGVIFMSFFFVNINPFLFFYKPLRVLGQSALFAYILHLAIIEYIIEHLWPKVHVTKYCMIYIVLSLFIIVTAYCIKLYKSKFPPQSFITKLLLGG